MLSNEEILILLQKLVQIHAQHFGYPPLISNQNMIYFMETAVGRLGAEQLLTPREVIRDFMDILHTLHQNPEASFEQIVGEQGVKPDEADHDEMDDFLTEFEL
ncbi:hypothetical protein D3C78_1748530 [compost metagenome]